MNLRKIIVSVCSIAGIFFITKCINDKIMQSKGKEKPKVTVVQAPLVKVASVSNQMVFPQIITEGKLTSADRVNVSLEGKGTLQSVIELKEGSIFKKRQRIAYVVDEQSLASYNAALAKYHQILTASLVDIQMEYPNSYATWFKFTNELKQNKLVVLPQEKNERLNNYLSSKGVVNTYYDLKSLQTSLTKRSFSAPFDGYVIAVSLQGGSFVNGTSKVCEIAPMDKLEVNFSIGQDFASKLKIGSKVYVNGQEALVTRIGQQLSSVTQQKEFTAKLNGKSKGFLAGDFVKITVPLSTAKVQASLLPAFCIDKDMMFLVKKDSLLEARKVTIVGERNDSLFVLGLQNDEKILLEAYSNFKQGQKVRPAN
jgi:multidrug efflux pump subunit AcrA (membrane-fusion protein)